MTKVHAYLARIKDQERDVIAVPDGAGRALCISLDKHWTFTREWDELHIIAPLVEDEGNDDPAVTRKEVRSVVAAHDPGDDELAVSRVSAFTDRLWALVSGSDPAVFVVRESDIAAVGIERDKDQDWTIPGRGWGWVWHSTAEELREYARENCDRAAACEAVARAIEQDVDPPDGHDVTVLDGTVWLDSIDHTPDEAVDLARALLVAAKEARDGVDR